MKRGIHLLRSHLGGKGIHQNANVCEHGEGRCHINANVCIKFFLNENLVHKLLQ